MTAFGLKMTGFGLKMTAFGLEMRLVAFRVYLRCRSVHGVEARSR